MKKSYQSPLEHQLNPGHSACAGCGEAIAMRHVADALGKNVIIFNATGCSEVTTSKYPTSSWKMPWLHGLFENAAALASGSLAALQYKGLDQKIQVVAQGGDGATFDIGLGLLSGMFERGDDILYICYDNEAYMNTGYQASGATPHDASTTTAPVGKKSLGNELHKKDMIAFALAHGVNYVATSTTGFPPDVQAKVKKALTFKGPKYLQILCSCVPGWGIEPNVSVKMARLAQRTGLFPVIEYENGQLKNVMKISGKPVKVEEYLEPQKRFKHLLRPQKNLAEIKKIQTLADENILRYGLIR
jgi:pyruvate ferredoxin oxidoreductase beta subunit